MSHFEHTSICLILRIKEIVGGQRARWVFIIGRHGFHSIIPKSLASRMTLDLQVNFNLEIWYSKRLRNGEKISFSQSQV